MGKKKLETVVSSQKSYHMKKITSLSVGEAYYRLHEEFSINKSKHTVYKIQYFTSPSLSIHHNPR